MNRKGSARKEGRGMVTEVQDVPRFPADSLSPKGSGDNQS